MIEEFLFPWKSYVMIKHPWATPIFMLVLSLLLSIITWIRQENSKDK
ncbi:MAG: hypothetical protein ACOWWH_11715 [Eubacteriaceae bacterium]